MRRNNRRQFDEERETNKIVMISFSVLVMAILAFVITFVLYRNYLNKQADLAEFGSSITDLGKVNEQTSSEASTSMGKTVNEMQEESNRTTNEVTNETNTEKVAINTSHMEKESVNTQTQEPSQPAQPASNKEEKVPDPTFIKPVEGEVMTEFAKDTLVYSNTLQEWVTHQGIDLKADKTTVVKASAEGTIKSIKNDPRYGITVVIEHVNGYSTIYSNLLTAEFVKEGESIKQGDTIGTVGNTATFEIADDSHLHFEITKGGEYVDPNLYLK